MLDSEQYCMSHQPSGPILSPDTRFQHYFRPSRRSNVENPDAKQWQGMLPQRWELGTLVEHMDEPVAHPSDRTFEYITELAKVGSRQRIRAWIDSRDRYIQHAHVSVWADRPDGISYREVPTDYVAFYTALIARDTRMEYSTTEGLILATIGNIPLIYITPEGEVTVNQDRNIHIPQNDGIPAMEIGVTPVLAIDRQPFQMDMHVRHEEVQRLDGGYATFTTEYTVGTTLSSLSFDKLDMDIRDILVAGDRRPGVFDSVFHTRISDLTFSLG